MYEYFSLHCSSYLPSSGLWGPRIHMGARWPCADIMMYAFLQRSDRHEQFSNIYANACTLCAPIYDLRMLWDLCEGKSGACHHFGWVHIRYAARTLLLRISIVSSQKLYDLYNIHIRPDDTLIESNTTWLQKHPICNLVTGQTRPHLMATCLLGCANYLSPNIV